MKFHFLSLAVLLFSSFLSFAQKPISVQSEVSDVTVFLQGAQVTRKAEVSLKAGENVVLLSGLTAQLDANSIQVSGKGDFMIMGVKHAINYLQDQQLNPAIESKRDSLQDMEFKLAMRRSLKSVFHEEKAMIIANRVVKGDDSNLIAEDLLEMADFFRNRLKEIEFRILEINQEEVEIAETVTKLRNELNSLNARWNRNTSSVEVRIKSERTQTAQINLSYLVYSAGWYPVYDLRAKDINSNVDLIYKGKIFQSTGNDWERVNLTLSTGNPTAGGQPPVLYPWYLHLYDPEVLKAQNNQSRKKERYDDKPSMAMGAELEEVMISADAEYMSSVTQTQESMTNIEFVIGIPYDVPSDNKHYEVEVMRPSIKADYRYFAAPRSDKDAFLLARITDWSQYNLMPGESNIYYQGTFVGKAMIDPAINRDTLDLSLGRDKAVVLSREQIKDFCKSSVIGGKKTTTQAYSIKITNSKSKAISIQIRDQIPLTNTSEVTVEAEELSGGKFDATTGFVDWDLNLAAGETRELILKYTIKYSKKKVISNL